MFFFLNGLGTTESLTRTFVGSCRWVTQTEEGEWLNDEPYAVIHRMASNGKQKGISTECLKWAFAHCDNIRIDTHRDNIVMQNLLKKHGFKQCGIIYISNGTERIAFHKIVNATNKES